MTLMTAPPALADPAAFTPSPTPDDVPALEAEGLYELVGGQLVEKVMGYVANYVAGEVTFHLKLYCRQTNAGHVLPEQSFCCFPHDPDLVRRPDVAFVAAARVPAVFPTGNVPFSPDLAVEVISPTNTVYEVDEKLADYWSAGVRMVWTINPAARLARVHQPRQPILEYAGNDVLRGDPLLAGFELPLTQIWLSPAPAAQP